MTPRAPAKLDSRERALRALVAAYDGEYFGRDLLDEWQRAQPLSEANAGLALELVMGVARVRIIAEHIAAHFYRGRWGGLRPPIRVILALGVYQLCWLERIPEHAAVDQAVRMAKRHGRGTAEMVNALLRKVAQFRGPMVEKPSEPDPRRYLAVEPARGRVFTVDVFPDPTRKPLDYLIAATGHPPWLVERWHRRFKPQRCRQVCEAGQFRPPLVLRPNRLKTTPDALVDRLKSEGQAARIIEGTPAVLVSAASNPQSLNPSIPQSLFQEGLCQPQDSTAQIALNLSPPRPGEFVLDLCAGVGTKSTQAAELMGNEGIVLATDIDYAKLTHVATGAERLGLRIVQTTPLDALDAALSGIGRPPDLILLDSPCTNTGVLARRPEARYRASQKTLTALTKIQSDLLDRAAALAGAQSRIIYTTCSLEKEENEDQSRAFCQRSPQWRIAEESFTLPDLDRGGGYAAVLSR
ncbi:MAG TPA: transcription antitermination factor NusB [Phycisphaerae bacterium]|nr:transcription antitermination factor NusB [Phycisphaerae bacterium]